MALLILSILVVERFHREQYTLFDSDTAYQKFINTAAALISAGKRIDQLYPDENEIHEKFDKKKRTHNSSNQEQTRMLDLQNVPQEWCVHLAGGDRLPSPQEKPGYRHSKPLERISQSQTMYIPLPHSIWIQSGNSRLVSCDSSLVVKYVPLHRQEVDQWGRQSGEKPQFPRKDLFRWHLAHNLVFIL